MNTPQIQVQYITSYEGLRAAMLDVLKEVKSQPAEENIAETRAPATRRQACQFLKISLPTLDALLKTKQIKSFNIGRQIRINWTELEEYIAEKG